LVEKEEEFDQLPVYDQTWKKKFEEETLGMKRPWHYLW